MSVNGLKELKKEAEIRELYTTVELRPEQMNAELYIHLLNNLSKKVCNRCNEFGFIKRIVRITDYKDNYINIENFSGNAVFNITYDAEVITPLEGDVIVMKVVSIVSNLIQLESGPLLLNEPISRIDRDIIRDDNGILRNVEKGTNLQVDDYFRVQITKKIIKMGTSEILIGGIILASADDDDVKTYFNIDKESTEETFEDAVEINEDII